MSRRKKQEPLPVSFLPEIMGAKVRPPVAVVLGSASEAGDLVAVLDLPEITCYQMDLYLAEQLRRDLKEYDLEANVITSPDLWDLPPDFQTVIYLPARGGERQLKIDMVEQSFHILRQHGHLIVWSPYEADRAFPAWLKKIFGKVRPHTAEGVSVFCCQRDGDRQRRRHEVTFQARLGGGPSLRFVSWPGVFSFGRFDDGARALVETTLVRPGERVLDLGCGVGTNGIFAAQRSGECGFTALVDSNVRAITLAELNAKNNGLVQFQAVATARVEGLPEGSFDVIMANPPYYAYSSIARLFIERSRELLRPGGRLYLVTRQPDQVWPLMEEVFGEIEALTRRGYAILVAQ